MKIKNKKVIILVVLLIMFVAILVLLFNKRIQKDNNQYNFEQYGEQVDKNQIEYQPDVTVEEIKNEIGATGNTDIYEVEQEYDGRNILAVKPSIKYKVAFAGMIKNAKPSMSELDNIMEEKLPHKTGIWVEEKSRDKILEIFNDGDVNSKYLIDDEGYLKIDRKNNQNDNDKKIEKIIKGKKQYILDISSVCYIVDDITGEILDYNFENMDKYQTYEYFEDKDKYIVFVTENSNNVLTNLEIFESIIKLLLQFAA